MEQTAQGEGPHIECALNRHHNNAQITLMSCVQKKDSISSVSCLVHVAYHFENENHIASDYIKFDIPNHLRTTHLSA